MSSTDSADPPGRYAPTAVATPPSATPDLPHRAPAADRRRACESLERLAADLDSIADRWSAGHVSTAAEPEQVRVALAEAQAALRVLSGTR